MRVTFLGTSVLLFDDGVDQIMIDCHVTRPSFLRCGLGQLVTDEKMAESVIDKYSINRLRGIFVSHSHYDHVMDIPYFAGKCNADVYGSESTLNVARGGDIPEEGLHLYEDGKCFEIGEFRITIIKSLHARTGWYNDDLGEVIDKPLKQPARKKDYKEGGSYDFVIENPQQRIVVRTSCSYIEGEFDEIEADYLFLGIGGLSRENAEWRERFFTETVGKIRPKMVIPIHWENFGVSLEKPVCAMPRIVENTRNTLRYFEEYCQKNNVRYKYLKPFDNIELQEIEN